jgi:tetratricopeptide (TPR) repeat protein
MVCYVCSEDKWHKLPGLHSQSVIQVCKGCGNLCHEVDPNRQQKMDEYYRKSYRKKVSASNLITATNKIQYIRMFLDDYLKDKKGLLVGDVGAATGYFLNEMKRRGHRVTGSELTTTFRRVSEHFYGIPLTEELTPKHKYDLISMYHVLEHIPEPDKALLKYREMLSENGCMFISTPFWLSFYECQDGTPFFNEERTTAQHGFDHVFHKDHINLFSLHSLPNLFRKTGFTVVKDNSETYGQSYLIKPGNIVDILPEDWQAVVETVTRQRQAMELFFIGKYNEAVKAFQDFPEAHCQLIFKVYGKDPDRQQDMLNELPDRIKNHHRVLAAQFVWLKQYNRLDEALETAQRLMAIRPNVQILFNVAEIYSMQGKYQDSMKIYAQVAMMHPYKWQECYDEIIANASQMPTWDEKGIQVAKETIFKQAMDSGKVKIPTPEPAGGETTESK